MAQLSESEIIFIILVSSIGMMLLVLAIIVFVVVYQKRIYKSRVNLLEKQQEFDERMIQTQLESQDNERKRIGAELHDSLGSLLWGAKVNASVIQRLAELPEDAQSAHKELVSILDEAIDSVRKIAWELTPDAFQHIGFFKSLERLSKQYNSNLIKVDFVGDPLFWYDDRALQAFRIVQELLVNAVKHSNASQIQIKVANENGVVKIIVIDNGLGITTKAQGMGLGWWSINKRLAQLNGKISIGLPPIGSGTEIFVIIPWSYDEE